MPHYSDKELRKFDALDIARTLEDVALRRYRRRYRNVSDNYIDQAYSGDNNPDPEVVAQEALYVATDGAFGTQPAIEG